MRTRWLWIGLALSVAVNLFVVGLWAGGGLTDRQSQRFERSGPPLAGLPPERRRLVRERLRAVSPATREDIRTARQSRRQAAEAVAAELYDRATAEAALSRSREAEARLRARTDAALLDAAAEMSVEERRVLAESVGRGRLRGPSGSR